jgi:hypothetical protein
VGVEASRGPHFSFSGMVSQTQAEALIDPGFMLGISVGEGPGVVAEVVDQGRDVRG